MSVATPRLPYTYADYCTLPEDTARRYELLQGELIRVPAPTIRHPRVSRNLEYIFHHHVHTRGTGEVFYSPVDWVLGQGAAREVAQPDLVVVSHTRRDIIQTAGIEGAPDLVVEILSPGTGTCDRGYKLTLYARYGVTEYWIVDSDLQTVEVVTLATQGYACTARYGACDSMYCVAFSGSDDSAGRGVWWDMSAGATVGIFDER